MQIYLARHGRTNYNDLGLCNSDPTVDVYLTHTGVREAEKLAKELRDVHLEVIFISELKRTMQTARIINKYHGLELVGDPRINDNVTGFEGRLVVDYLKELENAANRWEAKLYDGESLEDFKRRVRDFLIDLAQRDHDRVLVVTSQYVIYAVIFWLENLSNDKAWSLQVDPGSYRVATLPMGWRPYQSA